MQQPRLKLHTAPSIRVTWHSDINEKNQTWHIDCTTNTIKLHFWIYFHHIIDLW